MPDKNRIIEILRECIGLVTGHDPLKEPLGGIRIDGGSRDDLQNSIADLFKHICEGNHNQNGNPYAGLLQEFRELENIFADYYSREPAYSELTRLWETIDTNPGPEEQAECITKIFLPELSIPDEEIVPRWRLSNVTEPENKILPQDVVIQLNALYTLPDNIPAGLDADMMTQWNSIKDTREEKLADYDHPVPIFEKEENHELITCLGELNKDIEFEKEKAVFSPDYTLPVLISISVTHAFLDGLCGSWIESILKKNNYGNLKCLVLTEEKITRIKSDLIEKDINVYSVLGKYASHFNALKYTQLILEKGFGIKAGFKLDTDEGIHSKDLFEATGKTWFQTLCHPLWGASAVDVHGRNISLEINEGEYVNKKDIDALGYKGAMRTPDVNIPGSFVSEDIFFNKGFAHGKCTAMYNRFNHLEDHISHPVVKGGGYGITNKGLRKAVPFTYSSVGRAEDQQFYFCSLAGGCRGIFHPDLRIAHYKGEGGAVHKAEARTVVTRFVGDMYRLNIFSQLVKILPSLYRNSEDSTLKFDIDPMPGVFAGPLARMQSFLNLLYKAYSFCQKGQPENAELLLDWGFKQLNTLQKEIEEKKLDKGLVNEREQWQDFINRVDALDKDRTAAMLNSFVI